MNFLAHCLIGYRAHDDARAGLVAGGFLGDFLKGPVPDHLPDGVALGVRLHRRVDAYTNTHPGCRASARRFPARLRRPAPVFVDILGDHYLVHAWNDHAPVPLREFTRDCYACLAEHRALLSGDGQRFLDYVIDTDLFARYAEWPVVRRALTHVTRRLGNRYPVAEVLDATQALSLPLAADFESYFPDIVRHARRWVSDTVSAAR